MNFQTFSHFDALSEAVLRLIFSDHPHTFAIAGGSLSRLFPLMAEKISSNAEIFPADERAVPLSSPDSNGGKIHTAFAQRGVSIIDFDFPHFTKISSALEEKTIDVAILGIGSDGHFASIFPGSDIFSSEKMVEKTLAPPNFPISERASLAPKVLFHTKKVLFVLLGSEKSPVFSELKSPTQSASAFPAHFFQSHLNATVCWLERG